MTIRSSDKIREIFKLYYGKLTKINQKGDYKNGREQRNDN